MSEDTERYRYQFSAKYGKRAMPGDLFEFDAAGKPVLLSTREICDRLNAGAETIPAFIVIPGPTPHRDGFHYKAITISKREREPLPE